MGMRDFRLGIETLKNRGMNALEHMIIRKVSCHEIQVSLLRKGILSVDVTPSPYPSPSFSFLPSKSTKTSIENS